MTRDHSRTHRFLDIFQETTKNCEEIIDPILVYNRNKDQLKTISTLLLNGSPPTIQLHIALFERVKNSPWKGHPPTGFGSVVPRTLIILDEQVILCDENYNHHPLIGEKPIMPQNIPQYVPKLSQKISDVIELIVDPEFPTAIKIVFEEERTAEKAKHQQKFWDLLTVGKGEKKRIVHILSKRWKALFKLELAIKTP